MNRTPFTNTTARDMNQFSRSHEATTNMYRAVLKGGATPDMRKLAISHEVAAVLRELLRSTFGTVALATGSSVRLAFAQNSSQRGSGGIFERGSAGSLARARSSKKMGVALFVFVLVAVVAVLLYLGGGSPGAAKADALAQCLKQKNVVMYGAYWCPHCQNVKREFGSSFQYVPYVECTQDVNACNAANVKGYPTFIFPDGHRIEGEVSLEKLASESGCPAPDGASSETLKDVGASSSTFSAASSSAQ